MLWNDSEDNVEVRSVSVRKMKALTGRMDRVTLIGTGI
jgi:hypothetical protein